MFVMKIADTSISRVLNKRIILETILKNPKISRAELSRNTGLNKATVSYITKELEDDNIIILGNEKIRTGSRQALSIELNREFGEFIVLEIKHSFIKGYVTNLLGENIYESLIEINTTDFKKAMGYMIDLIDLLNNNRNNNIPLITIGISIPGTVTKEKKVRFVPFFKWKDVDIRLFIENKYKVKVYLENESNLSAVAEQSIYPFPVDNLISINVASGVGVGMIANGELQLGYNGFFGEFGHTTLVPGGKQCNCGNKGCFELYTSEYYVLKEYREKSEVNNASVTDFIHRLKSKDPIAMEVYENFINYFGIGIHNLIVINNPKVIVINSKIISEYRPAIHFIKSSLVSKEIHYEDLVISNLGENASLEGLKILIKRDLLGLTR